LNKEFNGEVVAFDDLSRKEQTNYVYFHLLFLVCSANMEDEKHN
jgi:hypothetical protein